MIGTSTTTDHPTANLNIVHHRNGQNPYVDLLEENDLYESDAPLNMEYEEVTMHHGKGNGVQTGKTEGNLCIPLKI